MSKTDSKIARISKGKRPQYFSDPATDKLLFMVLTLIGELSVTRDRLDTVERLLEENSTLEREKIENYVPSDEISAQREEKRTAYIQRIFRILEMELEKTKDGGTQSFEEVFKSML